MFYAQAIVPFLTGEGRDVYYIFMYIGLLILYFCIMLILLYTLTTTSHDQGSLDDGGILRARA